MTIAAVSPAVTAWPERVALTLSVAAFAGILFLAMRRGWRNRQARQSDLPSPNPIPADFESEVEVHGRYLASTRAGDWLDRLAVHGLGLPARAAIGIGPAGIAVRREGASDFLIPRAAISGIRPDRAIAGKAYETDGIAVVTWQLGEVLVDTGFRADDTAGHLVVLKSFQIEESR